MIIEVEERDDIFPVVGVRVEGRDLAPFYVYMASTCDTGYFGVQPEIVGNACSHLGTHRLILGAYTIRASHGEVPCSEFA